MSSVKHMLVVRSARPPIVEIDSESAGVYVRFSGKSVAKTSADKSIASGGCFITPNRESPVEIRFAVSAPKSFGVVSASLADFFSVPVAP